MLTIKKRFPWRRLYFYGSGAVIVGFAGIMTFLVQTNSSIDKFVSLAPIQTESNPVTQPTEESSAVSDQQTTENADLSSSSGTTTTWNGNPQPVASSNQSAPTQTSSSQATTEQPAPSQPATPTQPTQPAQPTPPAETEPENPTIVEEVIDIITIE